MNTQLYSFVITITALLQTWTNFKPQFMSLTHPHPIWTSCDANPCEIHKAVTTCNMLSGRYLTDKLQRHWIWNKLASVSFPPVSPALKIHLSIFSFIAPHLIPPVSFFGEYRPIDYNLLYIPKRWPSDQWLLMQLILDCTTLPEVIQTTKTGVTHTQDRLLYLGHSWCYSIHS